jgi:hypothetical protein
MQGGRWRCSNGLPNILNGLLFNYLLSPLQFDEIGDG